MSVLLSCASNEHASVDIINDTFPQAQAEIRSVLSTIYDDAMNANTEGLTAIHLQSTKFSKFGPRSFERQTVEETNAEEASFFTSIADAEIELKEIKIDVFGDVAIATFYPHFTFVRDSQPVAGSSRQTLVFVKSPEGWKIIHEHGTLKK